MTETPSSPPSAPRSYWWETRGFALAMMVDDSVTAPVLCQPSAPFAVSPARSRDVNLSPGDLDIVKGRCAAGQQVLGVRYRSDPAVGKRFETLTTELGDAFLRVELDGRGHSTVTVHRQQVAVDVVDAGRGLVEQQVARLARERARHLEQAEVAERELARGRVGIGGETELGDQRAGARRKLVLGPARRRERQAGAQDGLAEARIEAEHHRVGDAA